MRILVTGQSMSYLSGQPLYCYELAAELKRQGHDVTMISEWASGLTGADGHFLRENLDAMGVKRLNWIDKVPDNFDFCFASELMSKKATDQIPRTPIINIIHSEYEYETPLPDSAQIVAYACIRYSIMKHIINEHHIPKEKCHIIYNGVDRERFRPIKKAKRAFKKIIVPCTLDTLREPFLNKVIDGADEKNQVHIFGFDCGAKLHQNEFAFVHPDKFHIEEDIADADEVAGILLGRVNLEAWSCGIPSRVYDPNTLESKLFDVPIDFDSNHNIKNVVKKLMDLAGDLDLVTVVIPHYSAREKLASLLEDLRGMKHLMVIKNGSFAHNVNIGLKMAETPYVLISNDDVRFVPQLMIRRLMMDMKDYDIVGAMPDRGCNGLRVVNGQLLENDPASNFPSGALLLVKTEVMKKLGYLDEKFINGCEDIDLYLRAEKKGYRVGRNGFDYHHDCASSEGRYDHLTQNIKLFNKKWKGTCYIKV